MKLTDHLPEAVSRAIERERRAKSGALGPYLLRWVTPDGAVCYLHVLDAEQFAREDPDGFAEYLRSGSAPREYWRFASLLSTRLRPTQPETREIYDDEDEEIKSN